MGIATQSRGRRPAPLINVTPLIDVVLVLLITFMVVAPSLEPNLDVGLSAVVHDPEATVPDQLLLELNADGSVLLSGESVERADLHDRLAGALAHRDERILFFRAHPESVYGDVVSVLDVARTAGAENIGTVVDEASVGEAGAP
jgi:biopolymer transport protein ExbD